METKLGARDAHILYPATPPQKELNHSSRTCFEPALPCQARGSFYIEGCRARQTSDLGWGSSFEHHEEAAGCVLGSEL